MRYSNDFVWSGYLEKTKLPLDIDRRHLSNHNEKQAYSVRMAVCQGCCVGRKESRSSWIDSSEYLFGGKGERCILNLGTLSESI